MSDQATAVEPPGAPPPTSVVDDRLAQVSFMTKLMRRPELGAALAALVVFLFFALTTDQFGTLDGAANWTDVASTLGIPAVAVALLMIGGEFDLSAGVMTGSAGLVMGLLATELDMNIWFAIVLTFVFAATIGFINGMMVVKTKLPSFIVTLATFFILQGANLGVTKQVTGSVRVAGLSEVSGYETAFDIFGGSFSTYDFRITVLWWVAITIIATWLLSRTRAGNWIFGVGGDATAARNVGVPVSRVKIALFMTTALASALVGIMIALRLASVQAGQGVGEEFQYIIAAVVGGCLLTGGYGSAIGAAIGALIIGMAFIGIQFSGWDTDWRFLFLGVILLLAVLVNNLVRRSAEGSPKVNGKVPLLETREVSKYFGNVIALKDVSVSVYDGQVTCVLGDNGAGKSTFIKILSGVYRQDEGELLVEGEETHFGSPRGARERGIATVFQDLATVPLMSIWRNFFLGSEPTRKLGPLTMVDVKGGQRIMSEEMAKMGIDVRDPDQPVGTLSGGERQAVAISRAIYFGAKVLILDEPTSALGVKQSGIVLRYIAQARERGVGVIFITHNPHHAYPVGDRFVVLNRGKLLGKWERGEISRDELVKMMAGGAELDQLTHELEQTIERPAAK